MPLGAVCGSSVATAAVMTKISVREMRRYGYSDRLATGSVAAGGTLGILIPPSIPLVIYGLLTRMDITRLFIAGVVPGIILAVAYMLAIHVKTAMQPEEGPAAPACRVSRALGGTGARVGSAGPVCCRDGKHVYRHLYDDRGGGDRCRRGVSVRPDAQASETAFSAIDVVVWMVPV